MSTKVARKPRSRRIPQRTCVACRQSTAKRELVRIVRAPAGSVDVDPTGKKSGRGAYLCKVPGCWEAALGKDRLSRALKVRLTAEERETLLEYAGLFAPADEGVPPPRRSDG
jgi:predicted RNA-binding protein YlxR (DUF448 family)